MKKNFMKLWMWQNDLKRHLNAYATTTKDIEMNVWNGTHPVNENTEKHICEKGTRVRVWMASRFGDVGITDNLQNPRGYDSRVDADEYLTDITFVQS